MKKLIALMLAMMLAMSCAGAVAENVAVTEKYTLDEELFTALASMVVTDEKSQQILPYIRDLINNLSVYVCAGDQGAACELRLADQAVLSGALGQTEDGALVLVSDLFPHYALTVAPETIQALMQQLMSQVDTEKIQQAVTALLPYLQEYLTAVVSKVGEPENGEYAFDGQTFTIKMPVNITVKEIALLTLDLMKKLAQDENVAPLLSMLEGFDAAKIDEAIASAEASEDYPALDLALYANVNEETGNVDVNYVACQLNKDGETVSVFGGMVNETVAFHVLKGGKNYETPDAIRQAAQQGAGDALVVDLFVVPGDKSVSMELDVYMQMFLAVVAEFAAQDDQGRAQIAYYVGTPEKPLLVIEAEGGKVQDALPAVEIGERQIVSVEQLIAEAQEQKEMPTMQALVQDVSMYGLSTVLGKASAALPETVSGLMMFLMQQPGEAEQDTAKMEAPADEAEEEAEELTEEELAELEALIDSLMEEYGLEEMPETETAQ